jgi:hypothetical protein
MTGTSEDLTAHAVHQEAMRRFAGEIFWSGQLAGLRAMRAAEVS